MKKCPVCNGKITKVIIGELILIKCASRKNCGYIWKGKVKK